MAESIIMPKAGMAMEEGIILKWFIKEGDVVNKGDVVAEVETDKATMEVEADGSGTVLKILYPENETVEATKPMAWLGKPGESIPESAVSTSGKTDLQKQAVITTEQISDSNEEQSNAVLVTNDGQIKATPAARRVAKERGLSLENIPASGRSGEIRESDVLAFKQTLATPLATKMAKAEGIDLSGVQGSGVEGKVFSTDLTATETTARQKVIGTTIEDKRVALTNIQKITGKRMFQSHSEIPVVTINTKADVTELLDIRQRLMAAVDQKITINDFLLKATAIAIEENPRVNSVLDGDDLVYKGSINLNMAVATKIGLMVPVIKSANFLSIRQLSQKAAELVQKGKEGKIRPDDLEGGTFTISNVGMFGITSFTPIINQPQAAILGVCGIEDELKLVDEKVIVCKKMGLSLTFDHRIIDGAESAIFISRIRDLLEKPLAILA
jgi:pyruvate dehydrogenase E2 component (dihydrolipoamide acetyltransferase)